MNGRHKPRRPRWPVALDNMAIALSNAAKPPAADVDQIMAALTKAAQALREGVATELQWSTVAGAVDLSKAVERQGIVRGLVEHLNTTQDAMQSVYDRAMGTGTWQPPALWFQERDAIANFMDLHAFQIAQLSRAEFVKALDAATADIKRSGHRVQVVRDLAGVAA